MPVTLESSEMATEATLRPGHSGKPRGFGKPPGWIYHILLASVAMPAMIISSRPMTAGMRGIWLMPAILLGPAWGLWLLVWTLIRLPLMGQELRLARRLAERGKAHDAEQRRSDALSQVRRAIQVWAITPGLITFLALADEQGWFSRLRFAWNRAALETQAREVSASWRAGYSERYEGSFPAYCYTVVAVAGMAMFQIDGCEDHVASDWSSGGLVYAPDGLVKLDSWRAETLEGPWFLWRGWGRWDDLASAFLER